MKARKLIGGIWDGTSEALQELHTAEQLREDRSAEGQLDRRLDHLHLHQPGQLDLCRQTRQQSGHLAITLGRVAQARLIQHAEAGSDSLQCFGHGAVAACRENCSISV